MSRVLCACGCGGPAPLATVNHARRGWVKGQPLKYIRGHNMRKTLEDRYEVDVDSGCWIWTGKRNPRSGYGVALRALGSRSTTGAHRAVYEAKRGPIPDGMQLDHLCRNRACVNPDHMEEVTNAENVRRGNSAKINHAQAAEIFADKVSATSVLAKKYNLSCGQIQRIRAGGSW